MTGDAEPTRAEFAAAVAESDLALDLYLSGLTTGVKTACMTFGGVDAGAAEAAAQHIAAAAVGDPIAILELRRTLRAIILGSDDYPRQVIAYSKPRS